MSRLTRYCEVGNYVEKKDACIIPKSLGQVFDDDIVMGKAVDKLSALEDVLEELDIEGEEELKSYCKESKRLKTLLYNALCLLEEDYGAVMGTDLEEELGITQEEYDKIMN